MRDRPNRFKKRRAAERRVQQTIPSSDLSLAYEPLTNIGTFAYVGPGGLISSILPDGNYRATLVASGIANPDGTPLAQDHVFDFFFLRGDANHDGRVNLIDFNILAANFGQAPRDFTQGDFNYDTNVNLADFNILASRFGSALGASPSGRDTLPFAGDRIADETDSLSDLLA